MRFYISILIMVLLSAGDAVGKEPRSRQTAEPAGEMLVLGFAGDMGFSGSQQRLTDQGAIRHGNVIQWEELTSGIRDILAPDANFANLETVISDRSDLVADDRSYTFQASPAGLRHAVSIGVDVLSVANNHSADFGAEGILETIRYLQDTRGLRAFAGLGVGAARYQPQSFSVKNTTFAFGAIGIGVNPGGARDPGQPLYRSDSDFRRVTEALAAEPANLRILSVHYGQELSSFPTAKDIAKLRRPAEDGSADLIFGHHSHVPAGFALHQGKPIFFGLGNFLHAGTQNLERYGTCRDFGLFARVHYWIPKGGKPLLQAIEVIPLRDTNTITKAFAPREAAARIAVLNAFNQTVSDSGQPPMRFKTSEAGGGLFCMPETEIRESEMNRRCGKPSHFAEPDQKEIDAILAECRSSEPPPPKTSP